MAGLRIERDGGILRITLARPERRNAFDAELIAELTEAFADVGDARAVVLAGDGPSFCAGADIEWQRSAIDLSLEENVEDALRLYRMCETIDRCPAPVIARVQGYALGGGSGLTACADVAIAAPDAVFGFSEVKLGIIPAVISPFVLPRIGAHARRYFLTGERFDADTALRIGLVEEVATDLDAAVDRVLTELLSAGPEAVREAKRLIRERPGGRRDGADRRATARRRRRAGGLARLSRPARAGLALAHLPVRRLLLLTSAIVLVDTMFFAALTPLLPHYVDELGLGKAGAGVLQAMYPAGALVAGIPSGIAAARLGVKRTVLIGLSLLTLTTVAFGLADSVWALDLARFLQGVSSAFSWTGALAWLVAAAPAGRRGRLIGSAFGAAIVGALFGPVLGAVASFTGPGPAFGAVAGVALVLAAVAAATPAVVPTRAQPIRMLVDAISRDRSIQTGVWLCLLPALCFGTLSVLAPLRLSDLGWGAAAVGATYLVSAGVEAAWAPVLGRLSDQHGRVRPLLAALAGSAVVALLLPWPQRAWVLAAVIVLAGFAFGSFWTPAMSLVTDAAETRGLDYGYAFALVNLAWAPGQAGGAALGGAVASVTSDAVPYLALAVLCLLTFAALSRYRETAAPVTADR